jgi:hypothetical protein
MRRIFGLAGAALGAGAFAPAALAASLTLAGYGENFDSMGAAGTAPPAGWTSGSLGGTINRSVDGNGAIISRTLTVDNGSVGSGGMNFNHGATGDGERALGGAGTTGSGDVVHQVLLTNNTGATISGITLSYRGEQWRVNQATSQSGPEQFRLYYGTDPATGFVSMGSGFDFVAPQNAPASTQLDGNAAANSATISGSYTFPTPLADGQTFFIRWLDWNDLNTTDHPLSIDNVTVQGIAVPEPGSLALAGLGAASLLARRRARRA